MPREHEGQPPKDSVPIGKVGELLGVQPSAIRFWEQKFGLSVPRKLSERRFFTPQEIALFRRIKELAHDEKLTLPGVRARLEQEGLLPPQSAPPAASRPPVRVPRERLVEDVPPVPTPAHRGGPDPAPAPALPPRPDREQLRSERVQERERRVLVQELKRIREMLDP